MSQPAHTRGTGLDGVKLPFEMKSRTRDGTVIERGTPIRQLCDTDLYYLANRPSKGEDKYGIRDAAREELQQRAARRRALESVQQTIDIGASRRQLRELVGAL